MQALITQGLKELRDKAVFFFAMFNALFVLIVFMLTLNKDILHIDWPFGVKTNITITDDNQVLLLSSSSDHIKLIESFYDVIELENILIH